MSEKVEISVPAGFPAKDAQQCFELGAAAMIAANSAGLCVVNGAAAEDGQVKIEMRTFRGDYANAMNRFVIALGALAKRDEAGRLAGMGEIGGAILRGLETGACGGHCNCGGTCGGSCGAETAKAETPVSAAENAEEGGKNAATVK